VKNSWTSFLRLAILCVSLFPWRIIHAQDSEAHRNGAGALGSSVANVAADDEVLALRAQLLWLEQQFDKCNDKYSAVFVDRDRLRRELTQLQIRAANLLINKDDLDAVEALAVALKNMGDLQAVHDRLYQQLLEYKSHLDSALEILDPGTETPVGNVLRSKLDELFRELEGAERFFQRSSPAAQGNEAVARECRVLDVNDELQIVVLDVGTGKGVRPGMLWEIEGIGGVVCRARVIAARPWISGAMVISGRLRHIAPNNVARMVGRRERNGKTGDY